MGNHLASRIIARHNIIKLLNRLPYWFFPRTPRFLINPLVQKGGIGERFVATPNDEDDWDDGELNLTIDSGVELRYIRRIARRKPSPMDEEKIVQLRAEIIRLRNEIHRLLFQQAVRSQAPPIPPPLPKLQAYFASGTTSLCEDIRQIKLKTTRSDANKKASHDVRNELYDILKRRYASMHSPSPNPPCRDMCSGDSFDSECNKVKFNLSADSSGLCYN